MANVFVEFGKWAFVHLPTRAIESIPFVGRHMQEAGWKVEEAKIKHVINKKVEALTEKFHAEYDAALKAKDNSLAADIHKKYWTADKALIPRASNGKVSALTQDFNIEYNAAIKEGRSADALLIKEKYLDSSSGLITKASRTPEGAYRAKQQEIQQKKAGWAQAHPFSNGVIEFGKNAARKALGYGSAIGFFVVGLYTVIPAEEVIRRNDNSFARNIADYVLIQKQNKLYPDRNNADKAIAADAEANAAEFSLIRMQVGDVLSAGWKSLSWSKVGNTAWSIVKHPLAYPYEEKRDKITDAIVRTALADTHRVFSGLQHDAGADGIIDGATDVLPSKANDAALKTKSHKQVVGEDQQSNEDSASKSSSQQSHFKEYVPLQRTPTPNPAGGNGGTDHIDQKQWLNNIRGDNTSHDTSQANPSKLASNTREFVLPRTIVNEGNGDASAVAQPYNFPPETFLNVASASPSAVPEKQVSVHATKAAQAHARPHKVADKARMPVGEAKTEVVQTSEPVASSGVAQSSFTDNLKTAAVGAKLVADNLFNNPLIALAKGEKAELVVRPSTTDMLAGRNPVRNLAAEGVEDVGGVASTMMGGLVAAVAVDVGSRFAAEQIADKPTAVAQAPKNRNALKVDGAFAQADNKTVGAVAPKKEQLVQAPKATGLDFA